MEILDMIWEFVQSYLTVQNLLAAIVVVLGLVAAKTGLDFINEIGDIISTYKQAKSSDSPGGSDITEAERQKIRDEFVEAVESIWDKYRSTLFGFLGIVWNKIAFWKK